ncbi:MAG: flagellar biosynthesis regulator FlaF [Alphaproteobacteria bacterium]
MSHNKADPSQTQSRSTAAGAYDNNAQLLASDQRELEARILLKSNRMMQQLVTVWDERPEDLLEETLKYNRQIWVLFYDTAIEGNDETARPEALRSNIINLANFIFKREVDILSSPAKEKIDILININHEIASGLMNRA